MAPSSLITTDTECDAGHYTVETKRLLHSSPCYVPAFEGIFTEGSVQIEVPLSSWQHIPEHAVIRL